MFMWCADAGYVYDLHADYVTGSLLLHVEGRMRIWLYPPEQQSLLYLYTDHSEEIWEATSLVLSDVLRGERKVPPFFSRFGQARPLEIELQPGDMLFLPCEWAHQLWYDEPAVSVSWNVVSKTTNVFGLGWTSEGCGAFFP